MEATQHGPWPHWRDAQRDQPGQAKHAGGRMRLMPYRYAEHHAALTELQIAHGQEPMQAAGLPGDGPEGRRPGAGFIAVDLSYNEILAAGFVYATGTAVWLGPHCLIANPAMREVEGGKALVDAALDAVIEAISAYVAGHGGGHLVTFTSEMPVIQRARRHGYELGGKRTLMGKRIAAQDASTDTKG